MSERARRAIEAGNTGDKVPAIDPAAVPLHGDAEAAGAATPAGAIREDHGRQSAIARDAVVTRAIQAGRPGDGPGEVPEEALPGGRHASFSLWLAAAVLAGVVALALALAVVLLPDLPTR